MKLFIELNKLGSAVIVATHDLDLVSQLNKPILRLQQGRLAKAGRGGNRSSDIPNMEDV